jgi:hypothetical protein
MVLRDDEPKLYDNQFHRHPELADIVSRNAPLFLNLLGRIHALLWVLIVLGGLILMRVWK